MPTDDFLDVDSHVVEQYKPRRQATQEVILKSESDRNRKAFRIPEVMPKGTLGQRTKNNKKIDVANLASMMNGGDAFGFFHYDDADSIKQRRTLNRLENLVTKMAGRNWNERRKHLKAQKDKETYVTEPFEVADLSSFTISAKYEAGGGRSYELKDTLSKNSVGFRVVLVGDEQIIINNRDFDPEAVLAKTAKEREEAENADPEEEPLTTEEKRKIEEEKLFASADEFIKGFARQMGFNDICEQEIGLLPESPVLFSFKSTLRPDLILKRIGQVKGIGYAAFALAMYVHLPFGAINATIGGIPMPFPVEIVNDINNGSDHKAQSLLSDMPSSAVEVSNSATAPVFANQSLDAPNSFHGPNFWLIGDASNVYTLKPGVYALELSEDATSVSVYPSEILGDHETFNTTIRMYTDDSAIASEVKVRMADNGESILITKPAGSTYDGKLYLSR